MRHHRCVPGARPDIFLPRGCGGPPGAEGQFITWDQPMTSIVSPADLINFLGGTVDVNPNSPLVALWWGDGDRPRVWGGLPLAPADPDPLALTGVPVAEVGPYQLGGGEDVAIEGYDGTQRRDAAVSIDPAAGEDIVMILFGRLSRAASGEVYLSTRDAVSGQGFEVYRGAATQLVGYARTAGGAAGTSAPAAGHVAPGALFVSVLAWDRAADTVTLWTPGGTGAAGAVADGAVAGGDLCMADNPAHSAAVGGGGGLIGWAVLRRAGEAARWSAGAWALALQLRRFLSGIKVWSPIGLPSFTRATARVAQDRNGRLHRYSPGIPCAGDSLGYLYEDTVTNYAFRNIDITAAAGWQATGGVLTANVDDSAALAAAADGDVSGWGRVIELANATGVDRYLYSDGPIGVTTTCHLLCRGRMVAGAGARVGWYEPGGATFTDVGALVDAHAQTVLQNSSPPNNNCRWACKVPDGCTVRVVAQHAGRGANAPKYAGPNWLTAGSAARNIDTITIPGAVHSDGRGGRSFDAAIISMAAVGAYTRVINKGASYLAFTLAAGGAANRTTYTYDGTNVVTAGAHAVPIGTFEHVDISHGAAGQRVRDNNGLGTGPYDGTYAAGDITIGQASGAQATRIKNLRFYRQEHGQ